MTTTSLVPLGLLACVLACSDSAPPTQADQASRSGKPDKPAGAGRQPPALVELATVGNDKLTDGWTYLGQVEPALSAELATAVAGRVTSVRVREGDRVDSGATLVTLDRAKISAELAASRARERGVEAELSHARKQYERISTLTYPTVSEPERERFQLETAKLEAQLEGQKAETRRLQVEWNRHNLQAPFAGVISVRQVDPGAWVNVGTPVLTLVSLRELEIEVDVSAELNGRIQVGQSATLIGPGKAQAEIAGIVGALDPQTRTMRVRLRPAGEVPTWLLAGMAVDVEFAVKLDESAVGESISVPRDALIRGPVRTRVIKFDQGTSVPIYVTVLATVKDMALIRPEPDQPALAAGDRVVVRGNERLRPGQPLKVKD